MVRQVVFCDLLEDCSGVVVPLHKKHLSLYSFSLADRAVYWIVCNYELCDIAEIIDCNGKTSTSLLKLLIYYGFNIIR